jgi:hypothetical protein
MSFDHANAEGWVYRPIFLKFLCAEWPERKAHNCDQSRPHLTEILAQNVIRTSSDAQLFSWTMYGLGFPLAART